MFINVRIGAVPDDRCRIIIILNVSDAIFASDDVTDFFPEYAGSVVGCRNCQRQFLTNLPAEMSGSVVLYGW